MNFKMPEERQAKMISQAKVMKSISGLVRQFQELYAYATMQGEDNRTRQIMLKFYTSLAPLVPPGQGLPPMELSNRADKILGSGDAGGGDALEEEWRDRIRNTMSQLFDATWSSTPKADDATENQVSDLLEDRTVSESCSTTSIRDLSESFKNLSTGTSTSCTSASRTSISYTSSGSARSTQQKTSSLSIPPATTYPRSMSVRMKGLQKNAIKNSEKTKPTLSGKKQKPKRLKKPKRKKTSNRFSAYRAPTIYSCKRFIPGHRIRRLPFIQPEFVTRFNVEPVIPHLIVNRAKERQLSSVDFKRLTKLASEFAPMLTRLKMKLNLISSRRFNTTVPSPAPKPVVKSIRNTNLAEPTRLKRKRCTKPIQQEISHQEVIKELPKLPVKMKYSVPAPPGCLKPPTGAANFRARRTTSRLCV